MRSYFNLLCNLHSAFQGLVNDTAPATARNCKLPHQARVLLYRYRLIHGASFIKLGSLFLCGKKAARKAFWDIGMFTLMRDPQGSLPNLFDDNLTDAELERFLLDTDLYRGVLHSG